MPKEPTFDYDYLRMLMRDNPTWTLRQYADAVTQHEREVRRDEGYPRISVSAIASVRNRYRDQWREQGTEIAESRKSPTSRTQPFANLPQEFWWDQKIQNLRVLTRLQRGEDVGSLDQRKAKLALSMAKKLTVGREVIDLSQVGKPYQRKARLDEVDGEGNLITYSARYPGLTDAQWHELAKPEMRRAAAARWIHEGWADSGVAAV